MLISWFPFCVGPWDTGAILAPTAFLPTLYHHQPLWFRLIFSSLLLSLFKKNLWCIFKSYCLESFLLGEFQSVTQPAAQGKWPDLTLSLIPQVRAPRPSQARYR